MVSALYFGKHGCGYSDRIAQHLRLLGFDTTVVASRRRGEPLPEEIAAWRGDYIFCFRSYYILKAPLIEAARVAAINFHPGSPEYPGSGCVNWALYENSPTYGATAHLMTTEIDGGAIVGVHRFPVLPGDSVTTLLSRAHHKAFDLALDITTGVAQAGADFVAERKAALRHEAWRGKARRMSEIDRLQRIDPGASKDEVERVIRATYVPEFPPEVILHGHRFVYRP